MQKREINYRFKLYFSDSIDCIVSLLLHAILHPKRLNKSHKPTILEAQEDFVLHVSSFNIMQEKLEKMQEENKLKKLKIQPRIVVVGPELTKLNHFYVYLDGLKYKLGSFKKCLDLVIKISYVFQLKYSHITKHVWSFLENYFFGLDSERFPEVINLINILKPQN